MRVAKIKTQPVFDSYSWRTLGILTYGETNDFPQQVDELIKVSKTASACLDINTTFLNGMGFNAPEVGSIVVNANGLTLSKLKRLISADIAKYNGAVVHVNYNQLYKIRSITYIPFVNARLGIPNEDNIITKVALHPDWGRRDKRMWSQLKAFSAEVEWYDIFNPAPEIIEQQVYAAGGWDKYTGQVLYFSETSDAEVSYPIPAFIAALTDMRTEEGLSNVVGRNVCSNFMLSGILVDVMEAEQTEEQVQEKQKELMKFQGDEQALQLWYMQVKSRDEAPIFVPFVGENYDKAFTASQVYIPDSIGQAFKQPPILRAKDVGANFGADLMTNAYKFYNSITVTQRSLVAEMLNMLFNHWWAELTVCDFTTEVLVYNAGASIAERLGKELMAMVLEVIKDPALSEVQKRNTLQYGFGLRQKEILHLLPNKMDNNDINPRSSS